MASSHLGSVVGEQHAAVTPVDLGLALLRAANQPGTTLPAGFPARLDSPLAWVGADFEDPRSYVYQLTEADLAELGQALAHFKSLKLDGEHVARETFPLPTLGPKLDGLSQEVHAGRGFCLVRGVQPAAYTAADLTLVYLGVQAYIADQRGRQDSRGNMLVHIVADNSTKTKAEHHRHSNKSISFHTEETGDVVGWLTRSTPVAGGRCILASAYTVYNALAAHRPDLVRLLARADWPFAFPRFHCRPVVFFLDGRLVVSVGRTPLLGTVAHPRPRRLPRVSAAQREALDAFEALARATELAVPTQAGDMHFVNNLAVLHRRDGFTDAARAEEDAAAAVVPPTGGGRRHLVRMRLRSTARGWTLPAALTDDWARAFAPAEEAPRVWYPEPAPDGCFPLRKYPN